MADTANDTKKAGEDRAEPAVEPRAHDYVLVKHMSRHRLTRTLRAVRAGHRKKRFMLNDGTRIRRQGRLRMTEVSFAKMVDSFSQLLEGLIAGTIQVFTVEDQVNSMTVESFDKFVRAKANELKLELKVDGALLSGVEDLLSLHAAKTVDIPPPPKGSPTEVTRELPAESALAAAVDQKNAEMAGEANPPPSESGAGEADTEETQEEEEGYSEEELLKMSRKDLNKLAAEEFGIENPEKLPNIPSVVQAIMEAGAEE